MKNIFSEAIKLIKKNELFSIATVIKTTGSTPQKAGARMLIRQNGQTIGTLGGGCVESNICFFAKDLIKKGKTAIHLSQYELNNELAAQDGLLCGGTMFFFIESIVDSQKQLKFFEAIDSACKGGQSVVMVRLVQPGKNNHACIGATLLIHENENVIGTLGNLELDLSAIRNAQKIMHYGQNKYVTTDRGDEYFIEAFTAPDKIIIFGGGHIAKALAPLAKNLGFYLAVTDEQQEFANQNRFPEADMLIPLSPEQALSKIPVYPNTFIIIATRGHYHDSSALEAAVKTQARYIGLVGSRRKVTLIYRQLIKKGIPVERIKEVHAPVGLDIHAATPEEIALSIMAEILRCRNGGTGRHLKLEQQKIDIIAHSISNSYHTNNL